MPRVPPRPQLKLFGRYWALQRVLLVGLAGLVVIAGLLVAASFAFNNSSLGQSYMSRFPCVTPSSNVQPGFTLFTRLAHYLNFIYLLFLIRSGIQIFTDHPRLYTNMHCTPGTDWLRARGDVPRDRTWTAKEDSVTAPAWLGLPGGRHMIGIARHWHFIFDILWIVTGAAFISLQFADGTWTRLVPTTWELAPQAVTCVTTYGRLHDPATVAGIDGYVRFNALQQLTYFSIIFIIPPIQILAGVAMSPAFDNEHKWYPRIFGNRQGARSLHFVLMVVFIAFFLGHMALVLSTGAARNLNGIVLDQDAVQASGVWLTVIGAVFALALTQAAVWFSWRYPRTLQRFTALTVSPILGLVFQGDAKVQYPASDISPYLWPNGKEPDTEQWRTMVAGDFQDYRLRVTGLVENPVELTLDEIKQLATRQRQTTLHHCIQGWTGVAEWGGLPTRDLLDLVRPTTAARYAVFYSFGKGLSGHQYYEAQSLENLRHELSLLAYERNLEPLTVTYGAPLRLRVENQLGFKMVKWIEEIRFVADFSEIGDGQGGGNEDAEFFGYVAEI
jgi:thiosulfate reductase cytochrome b subunit